MSKEIPKKFKRQLTHWYLLPMVLCIFLGATFVNFAINGIDLTSGHAKKYITDKLSQITNNEVKINEVLAKYQWENAKIVLEIHNASIGDIKVDNIALGLDFWQLIYGNIATDEIFINNINIYFNHHHGQWQLPDDYEKIFSQASPNLQQQNSLMIKKIHIINSQFRYLFADSQPEISLNNANITLDLTTKTPELQLNSMLNFGKFQANIHAKYAKNFLSLQAKDMNFESANFWTKILNPNLEAECQINTPNDYLASCNINFAQSQTSGNITKTDNNLTINGNFKNFGFLSSLPAQYLNGIKIENFNNNNGEFNIQFANHKIQKAQIKLAQGDNLQIRAPQYFPELINLESAGLILQYNNSPQENFTLNGKLLIDGFGVQINNAQFNAHKIALNAVMQSDKPYQINDLSHHWAINIEPSSRAWVLNAVQKAEVNFANIDMNLSQSPNNQDWQIDNLKSLVVVKNGQIKFLESYPIVENIHANLEFSPNDLKISYNQAKSANLTALNGNTQIIFHAGKPDPITINQNIRFSGLTQDLLRYAQNTPLPIPDFFHDAKISGTQITNLQLSAPVIENPDVKYHAQILAKDAILNKTWLFDGNYQASNLELNIDKQGFSAKAPIKFTKNGQSTIINTDANVKNSNLALNLDIASDAKFLSQILNIPSNYNPNINGIINGKIAINSPDFNIFTTKFTLDLNMCEIKAPYNLFTKPSDSKANLQGQITHNQKNNTMEIGNLEYKDNENSLYLEDFKLSQDNKILNAKLKFNLTETGQGWINAQNNNQITNYIGNIEKINIADFVQNNNKSSLTGPPAKYTDPISEQAKLTIGKILYKHQVSSTENYISWTKRADIYSDIDFHNSEFFYKLNTLSNNGTSLIAGSQNIGKYLQGFDLITNMKQGTMQLSARRESYNSPLVGTMKITKFRLNNTGILSKLLELSSLSGTIGGLTNDGVEFEDFEGDFSKDTHAITIKDGKMSGPALGFSIDGEVNLTKNLSEITGTIIPYSSFLSIIDSIPIINEILPVTGKYALFGVKYKLSGASDDPELYTYPLSLLTPGYIRKIFDWVNF